MKLIHMMPFFSMLIAMSLTLVCAKFADNYLARQQNNTWQYKFWVVMIFVCGSAMLWAPLLVGYLI